MGAWKDEIARIRKLKKLIYKPPLPLKKQRTTARAQLPGKVKVFTEEEVFLFKIRRYANALFNYNTKE